MKMVSAREIGDFLGTTAIVGDSKKCVYKISKIIFGETAALSFCKYEDERAAKLINKSESSIVICSFRLDLDGWNFNGKTLILVPQPRLAFIKVTNKFFPWRKTISGVHPTAIVSTLAQVHPSAYIGPHCVISDDVEIGENSVLFGQIFIYPNVKIGKRVVINAGTIIGAEGFGYMPDEDGNQIQFPHIGGVIIEDDVEIGTNNSIARGALGDTIIRQGAKTDNLVHIAHNVIVGRNCWITCHFATGGSVEIGDNTSIGIAAMVKNQIKIGKNAFIGMGAVVVEDVPDNTTVCGNPARHLNTRK